MERNGNGAQDILSRRSPLGKRFAVKQEGSKIEGDPQEEKLIETFLNIEDNKPSSHLFSLIYEWVSIFYFVVVIICDR
jgi:hypothetical protein